jgi:acyl-CoA thioesterase-1
MTYIRIIMLVLIALIIYIVYAVYPIVRAVKLNSNDSLISGYEQHPSNPKTRVLFAGDSTGVGIGATQETSTAGRFGKDHPDADITNISISGYKLEDLLQRLRGVKGDPYDLIILQIGANDIVRQTSLDDIRTRLDMVLETAAALGEKVVVLTSGNVGFAPIFHFPLSTILTARTRTVRTIFLEEIGKHPHVRYVDLYKDGKYDPFEANIKKYYSNDGFHPSGDGYEVWYEEIKTKL